MPDLIRAKEPFRFYTRLHLTELTGLRAATLGQLVDLIRQVPGACIYHHTHRFLLQHQYLSPEPPNDFAYWVSEILGEDELGEQLASIDTMQFSNIRSLRERIVETISAHLAADKLSGLKFAGEGGEFHFVKSVSFIIPTVHEVWDLAAFVSVLKMITIDSIYFHVFESRLRLERPTNDFANWFEHSLGDTGLAREISGLDPYTRTLEDLRAELVRIIEERMDKRHE